MLVVNKIKNYFFRGLDLRTILGLFLAPLIPGFFIGLLSFSGGESYYFFWYIELSAALGYPPAILLGIPFHLYLAHKKWTNFYWYLSLGGLLGFSIPLLFFIPAFLFGGGEGWEEVVYGKFNLLGAVFGALAGLSFWLIAIYKNKKFVHQKSDG